jgi:hypothetical protein
MIQNIYLIFNVFNPQFLSKFQIKITLQFNLKAI